MLSKSSNAQIESEWLALRCCCLNKRQDTVERGLRGRNQELADLYTGALRLIEDEQNRGRVYFVAHAAREIINRLPDAFGLTKPRFNATKQIESLLPLWQTVRSDLRPTVQQLSEGEVPAADPAEINLPIQLARGLDRFFTEFESSEQETHQVKAVNLFKSLAPDHPIVTANAVEPAAKEYRRLAKWFVKEVHASEAGSACFEDCKRQFELLETFLFGLLSPDFYEPFDELHDIIKQANG